jgi:chloramphenicol O-acetyltransferase
VNERIKTLAEQAGISLSQKDFSYYWVESAEDIEKFAELIVRECADVANQHMEHNEGTDYNVGGKIKQHFGVEE